MQTLGGFPSVEIGSDDGLVILIRDRAQDDKLVKVRWPLDTVNLTYDWDTNNGRLAFVKTNYPDYHGVEVNQIHKLYYGDYLNSRGEIDNVLLKIRQSTTFGELRLEGVKKIRTCKQCPVFETLDQQILDLLATQNPLNPTVLIEGGNIIWEWKKFLKIDIINLQTK